TVEPLVAMNSTATEDPPGTKHDCSWLLFIATSIAFLLPLWFLSYITIYTEGEVGQILFKGQIGLIAFGAAVGFYRRRWGIWVLVVCGGLLISLESYQVRRWALLHEEVGAFARYAERYRAEHGVYPADLTGYQSKHEGMRSHLHDYSVGDKKGYLLVYFLNDPGTSYRYSPKSGYAYYPD
ncbi:MAG: hypothetical protein ACR2RV_25020, partial [Verrucomicrobiales bacterium]